MNKQLNTIEENPIKFEADSLPRPGENVPTTMNNFVASSSTAVIKEEKGLCTGFDLICCPCWHCHD